MTATSTLSIQAGRVTLAGDLTMPYDEPAGIIVFAHGSGSSRLSPRNRQVAAALVTDGFATLLFDLLTPHEEVAERYTRHLRFDIGLLSSRLVGTLEWLRGQLGIGALPIGLFGASTGAAAALIASTQVRAVGAVVSRGGRPDLAADALPRVTAPTLLIVGGADEDVLELNQRAMSRMTAPTKLHIVDGATHLFEEPGALEEVTRIAALWFHKHLGAPTYQEQPDRAWHH